MKPGAMTAMLNYYRAAIQLGMFGRLPGSWPYVKSVISTRCLLIMGANDTAIGVSTADNHHVMVPNGQVRMKSALKVQK